MHRLGLVCIAALSLSACSIGQVKDSAPKHVPVDVHKVPEPVIKAEPKSRYGNPKSYVVFGKRYHVMDSAKGYRERGNASWYGTKFHGRRTSSGEPYDMYALTAAHKTLPLPTYVRVTNLDNGRSLVVRVNDRGPFHEGRIIDLSYAAAVQLGVYRSGFAPVQVEALSPQSAPESAPLEAPEQTDDELDQLIADLHSRPQESAPAPVQAEQTGNTTQNRSDLPFLQIAAFQQTEDCQGLLGRLEERNLLALQVQSTESRGDVRCRVLQGPFATHKDADNQAQRLREFGYQPDIIYP